MGSIEPTLTSVAPISWPEACFIYYYTHGTVTLDGMSRGLNFGQEYHEAYKLDINERIAFFKHKYDLISTGTYSKGKKKYIGTRSPRRCRFCKRDESKITFHDEAHAIPEFLGNRQLILLDECDDCNEFFSNNLEDHLDKYTKPFRTIAQIQGKKKIPSYRSFDKSNRIEVKETFQIIAKEGSEFVTHHEDRNEIDLSFDIEPHIPAAVYKAFVKIAISIIETYDELDGFKHTINWIRNSDHSKMLMSPITLLETFIPGPRPIDSVVVWLFRRRKIEQIPYSIFVLAIGNFIYQLKVPSHHDASHGKTVEYPNPFFPSPFEENWQYGKPRFRSVNLSECQKEASKKTITMHYDDKQEQTV